MKPRLMIKKERHWLAMLALLTLMALFSLTPSVSAQTYRSCPPPYDAATYGSPLDLSYCDLSEVNLSNTDLSEVNLSNANLRFAYLDGASLRFANLGGADLSYANLSNAGLDGANLDGAILRSAYLSNADLSNANLSNADLNSAKLGGADLKGVTGLTDSQLTSAAFLEGIDLRGSRLSGFNLSGANLRFALLGVANLSNADLSNANLSGADLNYADLSGAKLNTAKLNTANLSHANLSNANLSNANLSGADLSSVVGLTDSQLMSAGSLLGSILNENDLANFNLSGADLSYANLSYADLSNANLSNANLTNAFLIKTDLSGADLTNADLTNADLSGATLSNITWSNTTCPDGSSSRDNTPETCFPDTTAPVISPNVSGTLGNNRWYISDVTVSWAVSDPESGIVSTQGCETQTFDDDTFGSDIICRAANGAGQQTEKLIDIRRDATPPIVSVTNVEDGASYILGSVPTAGCDTQDAFSGVATEASLTITGGNPDGTGTFTATCDGATDFAGNIGSASVSYTVESPDNTPPMISANVSGTQGNNGWYISDVEVSFICADEDGGSGIATDTVAGTTLASEGAGQSVTNTGTCTDNAGNTASSVTVSDINIDQTAPTASAIVSPSANVNGWHNSDVTVSFSGSDNLSGVAGCDSDVILSSDGSGQSASGACTDNAGNVSATATAEGINIDKTAPVVSVTGVEDSATYILGSVPTAGCDTTDALSGVATVASLSLSGGNSNGVGSFTATCDGASDNAGNTASASVSYSVSYDFGGFTGPIDPQAVNQVKAGQTVPVKFSLNGDQGMAILAAGYPVSQEVACDGSAPVNEVEETGTTGNSGLSYDSDSDQYSYNWKTDKGWSGTCRQLIVQFDDGSAYSALFQFK